VGRRRRSSPAHHRSGPTWAAGCFAPFRAYAVRRLPFHSCPSLVFWRPPIRPTPSSRRRSVGRSHFRRVERPHAWLLIRSAARPDHEADVAADTTLIRLNHQNGDIPPIRDPTYSRRGRSHVGRRDHRRRQGPVCAGRGPVRSPPRSRHPQPARRAWHNDDIPSYSHLPWDPRIRSTKLRQRGSSAARRRPSRASSIVGCSRLTALIRRCRDPRSSNRPPNGAATGCGSACVGLLFQMRPPESSR
jgi:hypothetical protein